MQFKRVDLNEFETHKIYYFDQIPKAQNSSLEYKHDVFEYYQKALKECDKNFLIVCIEQGEVIGCAFFRFYSQEGRFFLLNVNTRKDFQHSSKKVATNTLKFGFKEFFKLHDRIFLWVDKNNVVAQTLYKKLGFTQTDYYPENLEFLKGQENQEIIMELGKAKFESSLNAETVEFFF